MEGVLVKVYTLEMVNERSPVERRRFYWRTQKRMWKFAGPNDINW